MRNCSARSCNASRSIATVLTAEGSESYEVSEVRHLWERFHALSTDWLETAGRWQSGVAELARIDVRAVFPGLPAYFAALDANFAALADVLAGRSTDAPAQPARLEVDPTALQQLSAFDRAAVEVARKEMERIGELTAALVACARELAGDAVSRDAARALPGTGHANRSTWLPVPDWDHVRRAAFVAATTGVGFLIWILFDPPGHSAWFQVSGTIALLVAGAPHARASKFIAPVAVTSAICLAIYVLVMPQLSSFLGLGTLLFLCMFLVHYFFTGMARLFCNMAILNMLQIQNEQVYSFYVMVNVFLFLVMGFTFLFVMSYMLGSPRPEKTMLRMLDRFFRSAEFLMSRTGADASRVSLIDRWRIAFHQRRLQSMPAKLAAWGTAIDRTQCPDTTPEHIQALVVSLQALVHRLEQLMEAAGSGRDAALVRDLRDELATWHAGLEVVFGQWARHPEAEPVATLEPRLERQLVAAGDPRRGGREQGRPRFERRRRRAILPAARRLPRRVGGGPRVCRRRAVHQLVPMAGGVVLMTGVPRELTVGGVYLPPMLVAAMLGVSLAFLTARLLNRYRLSRYLFYPPLVFVALTVLYTVAVGYVLVPF